MAKPRKTVKPDRLVARSELKAKAGLDVSETTLWRMIRSGKLPAPVMIGSRQYWLASEIDRWISDLAAARDDRKQSGAAA